ncbi:MAG TPA: porin [Methylomirabilota bacterium]|nr:porin [Methylomirabilota bacterium]
MSSTRHRIRTFALHLLAASAAALFAGAAIADESAPESSPPSDPDRLQGTFKNGFTFATADGKDSLRVAASFHLDLRTFGGDSEAPTSFDIRRARIDLRGRLRGWMSYRIQASFENEPYIRNAWVDLKLDDALHVTVGQMKVPFSTSWMTFDNQVNFVERGTAAPVYPFFDRGVTLWGEIADRRLTYQLGAFTGTGVDLDSPRGDIDDHKDATLRLFAQPFRKSAGALEGLYVVGQGTYGPQSVATKRFESGGLTGADFASRLWRWRLEQVIGSNGRSSDIVTAEIGSRNRWGFEAHWLHGPVTASLEVLELQYDDVEIYHDYLQGSTLLIREPLLSRDGSVRSSSLWLSWFVTGEGKSVDAFGWRQPDPKRPFSPGKGGIGAWELLARISTTTTDLRLFDSVVVPGFTAADLDGSAVPVGEGESVRAAVLDGAAEVWEATLGVNWTVNSNLRFQLNLTSMWVPDPETNGGILSAANSGLADPALRNRKVDDVLSAALRLIFRF